MIQVLPKLKFPVSKGEFWTGKQRKKHPLHYIISYRAAFKPELPEFFIKRYAQRDSVILDPFAGRGTVIFQANLMGYRGIHNDISPLSCFIGKARQFVPAYEDVIRRLETIPFRKKRKEPSREDKERFYPFFHPETFKELLNLREEYLHNREDRVLQFIILLALSRLHGHSGGFFSTYTFPQFSVSPEIQRKNNRKRNKNPEYREVKSRIYSKFLQIAKVPLPEEYTISGKNQYFQHDARKLSSLQDQSVDLIITSPPFLDKVNYVKDNWLRSWFLGIEEEMESLKEYHLRSLEEWQEFMYASLREMLRVLKTGGRIVIEVGDVQYRKKKINLDEVVTSLVEERFTSAYVDGVIINTQNFTKLSHCWNVENNKKGTNSNRCIVIKKLYHVPRWDNYSLHRRICIDRYQKNSENAEI